MISGIPELQVPPDLSPSIDSPKMVCGLLPLVSPVPEVHCELLFLLTLDVLTDKHATTQVATLRSKNASHLTR